MENVSVVAKMIKRKTNSENVFVKIKIKKLVRVVFVWQNVKPGPIETLAEVAYVYLVMKK